mmetsp:Transcript_17965/g.37033  ORF Transcript_17965/g.37033 Transcript_17965/m.37033 type:complete len:372 (-) Transcript_17965:1495-2610(-)
MVGYNSKRQRSGDASLAAADSLALPIDKEFDEEGALSDEGDGKFKDEATKKIVTRRIVLCFSSVVLVGIIVLSVILARMKGDGLGKSTDKLEGDNIFLSNPSDIYALLEPRVHNPEALLDMDTPEGRAFNILLNETKTESSIVLRPGFYTQRYALLVLYFGTNGENWTNTTGWSDRSEAYEEWHGVHAEDSVVVGIDLEGNNLQGKIAEDFCLMSGLNFVRLSSNMVGLPSCLSKLSQLRELDFRRNGFVGGLPSNLYTIPSLTSLQLSDNEFVGSIDTLFPIAGSGGAIFPNLRDLDLSNNDLSGKIPESVLRRLPSLDTLILHGNLQLSGSLNEMCKGDKLSEIDADCDVVFCRCCVSGKSCPSSSLGI